MRSIRLMAATTAILFGVAACGDDGNGPDNQAPVASFTQVCTGLSCVFTDGSTDEDGSIASRSWTFESGTPPSSVEASQTVTFAVAGTYTVTLTVTDNEGASDDVSQEITVTTGTTNTPPTASFQLPATCTAGTPCGFHSTSTDADGTIAPEGTAWDFGDTGVGTGIDVTHTYEEAGTYTVTLTVTDNLGATATTTQQLTVSEPTSQNCTTTGTEVHCSLTMNASGTLTFTVVSESCELGGNTLRITAPLMQTVFFNLCNRVPGETHTIQAAGGGGDHVFAAGDVVQVEFAQGAPQPDDPPTGDPGIQISGTAPSWTLNIDDGGAAGTPGEPDFNDAVVSVQLN
jgi:PKD repeat protein